MQRSQLIPLICLFLAGCAATATGSRPPGMHDAVSAELVFGRNLGADGKVSDPQWAEFVDEDVTPRFPDGFTVKDASGEWRGHSVVIPPVARSAESRDPGITIAAPGSRIGLAAVRDDG